ncbi:MAG: class I SAM-dependent methyltransferase [bacterium]|nr:class I SAM-dependent methyltransferase [bacterium]
MNTELETKIEKISKVLNVEEIISLSPDKDYIRKYYRINRIPYSLFHTSTDRIYMGISRDGVYKEDDLLGIARIVSDYISKQKAQTVLELATGRGANSFYLAQQFPDTRFSGVDISEAQLSLANKKARKVGNYSPELGDYHDLSRFKDNTFDIVFVVEALCYSTDKGKVLQEVNRILKDGGLFIIFDGYLNKKEEELTEIEKLACDLGEKGMALTDFESYQSFLLKAKTDFRVAYEEDLSIFIIPTMKRFERMGKIFFDHPTMAKIASKILPKELINNAATGYLMPTVMKNGLYCYMLTVLAK